MQLCVGIEFLFPLAKPSRSFQNLTETPPGKRVLLSSFCFPKVVKWPQKIENRFTNKIFTPKTDPEYKFFHCENVSKGWNHFFRKKRFRISFNLILNAATLCLHIRLVKTPLHPLTYNKTGVNKGITYSSYICFKHRLWVLVRTATLIRF